MSIGYTFDTWKIHISLICKLFYMNLKHDIYP